MRNWNLPLLIGLLASVPMYIALCYFTVRTDFYQVLFLYLGLFGLSYLIYQCANSEKEVKLAAVGGILFRVLILFSFPNLSDDIYRFYWDGLLIINDIAPFQYLPSEILAALPEMGNAQGISPKLFSSLNSQEYYTIYPPVCQWIFATAASIFPQSIGGATVVMKLFLLFFEIGSILVLHALSKVMDYDAKLTLLYALNPLVIVELVGNVHFESAMIFFLLTGIYLLLKNKWKLSALAIAFSICSKLLPLMLLPFFIRRLGWKKSLMYFSIVGIATLLMFAPFLNASIVQNFADSIGLYFGKFEFNASAYHLIYKAGEWFTGEPFYAFASRIGAITTFLYILFMAYREPDLSHDSLLRQLVGAMGIYFLFTSTVHPWYLATLVALAAYSCFRFPMLWSALIVFTYATYMQQPYQQIFWINGLEYILVIAYLFYENYQYLKHTALRKLKRKHLEQECGLNDTPAKSKAPVCSQC